MICECSLDLLVIEDNGKEVLRVLGFKYSGL
jgi:hypothetical protein